MTDNEILNKLTLILRALLGDDSIVLQPQTTRQDVPGWDSFNYLSFIVATEREFHVKFRLAEIEAFENVGVVIAAIKELRG